MPEMFSKIPKVGEAGRVRTTERTHKDNCLPDNFYQMTLTSTVNFWITLFAAEIYPYAILTESVAADLDYFLWGKIQAHYYVRSENLPLK